MLRRILESPWPYFVGAGLLLVVAVASQFEIQLPSRPVRPASEIPSLREREHLNVVFIVVDTLRADRLGAYGYERPTSATIDALASQGILFRHVMAQSTWTKASMASMWTSTYPANNGVVRFNHVLPQEALLPAEIFRKAGYRTAGIWRNGWVAPNFGFDQGFEFYLNPKPGREHQRLQGGPSGRPLPGSDEDLVTSSFEFIDNFGQERFFLYLHFMDVHQYVYEESSARFGTSYSDVYDQAIHWIDRLIGLVLERIDGIGQLENTVVVVASDHGEAFLEHGIEGHARNLYSEVVNVPLVIGLPIRLHPGIVVEEPVQNVDIWPTILDLVGLPPLPGSDGKSLLPLVMAAAGEPGATASGEQIRFAQLDRRWGSTKETDPMVAVTDGDRRLVWRVLRPERSELYDLSTDPGEQENLYDPEQADSRRLQEVARQYYENGKSPWGVGAVEVEVDELRLNQLRALGYVIR